MEVYTAIDLFAGCGGATLGLKAAGIRVCAAIEADPVAGASYALNHPEVALLLRDIREVSVQEILDAAGLDVGQCAVVIGCPPCQGFSTHRLRDSGANDARNGLVLVFADIVERISPAFFVFENVTGLLKPSDSPWYIARAQLARAGYRIAEGVIQAADYGVPQRRKRFTAIGCRLAGVEVRLPERTHARPRNTGIALAPWQTVRDAIGDLPPLSNGERSESDPLHYAAVHSEESLRRFAAIPPDGGSRASLPADLQLACHTRHTGHRDVYGRLWWDRPANTVTGGCTQPSKGRFLHPEQNRGLTLREAARLQGFPDSYRFEGAKQQVALQIGNAVPPAVARALARVALGALDAFVAASRRPEAAAAG